MPPTLSGLTSCGETTTRNGQLISFDCPKEHYDEVREFLAEKVDRIYLAGLEVTAITHGSCGKYSRFQITQHKYAGGNDESGGGYMEVLRIHNPPDGRADIVIHEYDTVCGSRFSEWETLDNAKEAFSKCWGKKAEHLATYQGFKRLVECHYLTPWFYAVGNMPLLGDFAFPYAIQDDPVFRVGQKFVVEDSQGITSIKTCVGTRFISRKRAFNDCDLPRCYRLVHWHDGTIWDESGSHTWWKNPADSKPPRPLDEDKELWILEALAQFRRLLSGKTREFTLRFLDGSYFVGRLKTPKNYSQSPAGNYFASAIIKGKDKPRVGWINGFNPTPECPDIVSHIKAAFAAKGHEVLTVEIIKRRVQSGSKKWFGVFYDR